MACGVEVDVLGITCGIHCAEHQYVLFGDALAFVGLQVGDVDQIERCGRHEGLASCGGAVVNPGDYIFGDIDGVMVIPYEHVDKVLEQALLYMEWEAKIEVAIKKGLNAQEMKEIDEVVSFNYNNREDDV